MPYFIDEGKKGLLLKEDAPQQLADLMTELLSVFYNNKENVAKMPNIIFKNILGMQ